MIPPLSAAAETNIRQALEAVADATSEGADPTDAIVKVAADAGLPPGHVDLLVRGYNIARTTWQRQSGGDVLEKAADFAVADPAVVRQRLFADHAKEAGARLPDCPDYDSTDWYVRGREKAARLAWRQVELPPLTEKTAPALAEDPKVLAKRAYAAAQDRVKALETDRLALADTQQQLERTFAKLAEALDRFGAPSLADLRPDVQVLYGRVGEAVLDQVGRTQPNLLKRASAGPRPFDHKREPYALIDRAVTLAGQFQEKLAAYEKAEAKCDEAVARHLAPYIKEAAVESELLADLPGSIDINPTTEKQAGPVSQFGKQVGLGVAISGVRDQLSNFADKMQGYSNKEKAVERQLGRISSPDHEDQLREIQTRAMLQDLLTSDPVISGYDPHEVAAAFNELSQLAPRTAAQPVLARALLRKQLQLGALDSFEGNEAVGTEHKLREMNPIYQALPKPGAPHAAAAKPAK